MKVKNISLRNSEFTADKGSEITDAEGIRFDHVTFIDQQTRISSTLEPTKSNPH